LIRRGLLLGASNALSGCEALNKLLKNGRKENTTMKKFSIREVETLKTTHALYGVVAAVCNAL
jgi:hypothetical protein